VFLQAEDVIERIGTKKSKVDNSDLIIIMNYEAVAEWILHFVQNDKTAGLCHSEGAKRPKNPSYSYYGRSATRSL
jgi:hypothetical protein